MTSISVFGYDIHTPTLTPVKEEARPAGEALRLVAGGEPRFAIVADLKAEERTKDCKAEASIVPAVQFLKDAFEKTVGKAPEVVDAADAARVASFQCVVAVGDSELARKSGVDAMKLPDDGFTISTFPRGVVIAGNDSSLVAGFNSQKLDRRGSSRGTGDAAVDFAERFLGARFYFPGPYGTFWPKIADLTVSPVRYSDSPWYRNHGASYYYVREFIKKQDRARWEPFLGNLTTKDARKLLDRWRVGGTGWGGGHHCPEPHAYLKHHPGKERTIFYTSPKGKFWYNPLAHIGNYYNVLDLSFADMLADDYVKFIETQGAYRPGLSAVGGRKSLSFGVCDTYMPTGEVLEDPVVKRLNLITKEDIARGKDAAMSNIYGRFYQHLGNRLKESIPDAKLWLLIYYNSTYAPRDPRWKLPDNIEINFCARDLPKYTRNAKKMDETRRMLQDWYDALGGRPAQRVWLYNSRSNPFARAVAPEFIADIPKIFGKLIGREAGLFYDWDGSRDIWNLYWCGYVAAKAQWNPDFDVDAAIDAHWNEMYGPKAGPHLCRFHRLLKDAYLKHFVNADAQAPVYPPSLISEMEKCLKDAEAALDPSSVEARRLRLVAEPWPKAFASQRALAAYNTPVYAIARKGAQTSPMTLFDPLGRGVELASPTDVRLWWDERGVHGRVDCAYAPKASLDSSFWNNDTVELIFAPGLKKEVKYMVAFDATGRRYSEMQRLLPIPQPVDLTWKGGDWTVKTNVRADSWSAEFFVPFSAFECGAPRAYDTWNLNVVRTRRSKPGEVAGNSLTMGNNHNVVMFGAVVFAGEGDAGGELRAETKVFELGNSVARYPFRLSLTPARGSKPGTFSFKTAEFREASRSGISSLIKWLDLSVNGTSMDRVLFRPQSLRQWSEPGRRGVDFTLDYDGAMMDVRMWLEDTSSILRGSIAARDPAKVKDAKLVLSTIPSRLAMKEKGKARFRGYRRTHSEHGGWHLFGDADFDGSAADGSKGWGPTAFFVDPSTVRTVKGFAGENWTSRLEVRLDPSKKLSFGLYENFGAPKTDSAVREILGL